MHYIECPNCGHAFVGVDVADAQDALSEHAKTHNEHRERVS